MSPSRSRTMRTLVLLLACFAYACHGRRVQAMPQHSQGRSSYDVQDSKEFVNLLFSLKPEVAFNFAAPGSHFRGGPALVRDNTPGTSYASGGYSRASPSSDYYAHNGITHDYHARDGFTRGNSYRSSPNDYYAFDGSNVQGGEMARQRARRRDAARRNMWQGGEMGRYGSSPNDHYAWDGSVQRGEMARQQARRRDAARRNTWQGGYGEMASMDYPPMSGNYGYQQPYGEPRMGGDGRSKRRLTREEILSEHGSVY